MDLQIRSTGPVEIVTLHGTIDGIESGDLRRRLNERIDAGRTRLLLDMSSVDFIDSTGLSALIGALKTTRRIGGNIGLLNPAPTVRSVLELTRLHRILEIFSNEKDGVDKLGS